MAFSPNFLSQRDPKWRGETLGFDTSLTLGSDGCALTCLAMLVNGYGFDETPSTLNAKLKALGSGNGFLGGLIVWGGLSRLFPKITFQRIVICRDQPAPLQAIDQTLDAGQPLVVEIDSSPAAGLQNHWVVLYARQGDDYLMLDPYPYPPDNRAISLGERYARGRSPAEYITAVVWYQAVGLGPGPTPGAGLTVRIPETVTAGLRVRAAPTTASATLTIEPPGSLLKCLEPESVARPKIGVYDQWLRVSTTGGVEGYVAAWYVEAIEQAAPAPVPAPPSPPAPAPVPEPAPSPVTPPEPPPAAEPLIASVLLSVGTSGLRVRSQPSLAGGYVGVVKAGRQVTVLDPPEEARPKMGKSGAWVFVRTADGKEGYVQAQYLTLGDAVEAGQPSTPPPEPPPQPAPQPAPVSPLEPEAAAEAGPLIGSVRLSVGTSGLRVRTQPSLAGGYVTTVKAGRQVTLLDAPAEARAKVGQAGRWLHIRTTDGREGYVQAQYVTLGDAAAEAAASTSSSLTVTVAGLVGSGGLRLRSGPSTSSATLKIIAAGMSLTVLESAAAAEGKIGVYGQWLKVREPQGTEGYVAAWYVQR